MYSDGVRVIRRSGKLLCAAVTVLTAAGVGSAQTPTVQPDSSPATPIAAPTVSASTGQAAGATTTSAPIETSPTPAETKLFLDAMRTLRKAPFAKIDSLVNLTVVHDKETIVVDESLSITGGNGGQFRSEVQVLTNSSTVDPSTPTHREQYTVANDGKKQVVYQHGNDTYAVSPAGGPKDLFSQMFQGLLFSMKASKDLQFADFDKFKQQGNLITVTAPKGDEAATGKVLHLMSKDGTLQARFVLDPATGHFDKMQLQVTQPGLSLVLTEHVTQQSLPDSADPALFEFTPPHSAKKVPSISVGMQGFKG